MQYLAGAQQAGHQVRVLHIEAFPFAQPDERSIHCAQAAVTWADHIVMVYPNWWGTLPAALKAWLDCVLVADFAFRFDKQAGSLVALLKGKTARLLITMDTPSWVYRLLFANGGVHIMRRAVLGFCGVRPVRVLKMGPLYKSDGQQRTHWLAQARRLGLRAA